MINDPEAMMIMHIPQVSLYLMRSYAAIATPIYQIPLVRINLKYMMMFLKNIPIISAVTRVKEWERGGVMKR